MLLHAGPDQRRCRWRRCVSASRAWAAARSKSSRPCRRWRTASGDVVQRGVEHRRVGGAGPVSRRSRLTRCRATCASQGQLGADVGLASSVGLAPRYRAWLRARACRPAHVPCAPAPCAASPSGSARSRRSADRNAPRCRGCRRRRPWRRRSARRPRPATSAIRRWEMSIVKASGRREGRDSVRASRERERRQSSVLDMRIASPSTRTPPSCHLGHVHLVQPLVALGAEAHRQAAQVDPMPAFLQRGDQTVARGLRTGQFQRLDHHACRQAAFQVHVVELERGAVGYQRAAIAAPRRPNRRPGAASPG